MPERRDYLIEPLSLCAKRKAHCFRLRDHRYFCGSSRLYLKAVANGRTSASWARLYADFPASRIQLAFNFVARTTARPTVRSSDNFYGNCTRTSSLHPARPTSVIVDFFTLIAPRSSATLQSSARTEGYRMQQSHSIDFVHASGTSGCALMSPRAQDSIAAPSTL